MIGEGVLHRCLAHPQVSEILLLNRKSYGLSHPKIKEVILPSFWDLNAVKAQLAGYDACFFCAGISSLGISKEEYEKITHDMTLHVGKTLADLNPNMTFMSQVRVPTALKQDEAIGRE